MELPYDFGIVKPAIDFDLLFVFLIFLVWKYRKKIWYKLEAIFRYVSIGIKGLSVDKEIENTQREWRKIFIEIRNKRWSLKIIFSR